MQVLNKINTIFQHYSTEFNTIIKRTEMTYRELIEKIGKLFVNSSSLDVDVSTDFQSDQTGGYPASLCVLWDKGKA